MAIRRILVPTDFSTCSAAAMEVAIDLAKTYGAEVELLHVWMVPPSMGIEASLVVEGPGGERLSLAELVHVEAERALARAADELARRGLSRVHTRLVLGDPALKILAESERFDLIVMGTHGRGAIGHALFGSVAERVVRKSRCPVLTVRDGEPPRSSESQPA